MPGTADRWPPPSPAPASWPPDAPWPPDSDADWLAWLATPDDSAPLSPPVGIPTVEPGGHPPSAGHATSEPAPIHGARSGTAATRGRTTGLPTSSSNWLPWLTEGPPTYAAEGRVPPVGRPEAVAHAGHRTAAHHGAQAFGLRPSPGRPLTPADLRTDFGPPPATAPTHLRTDFGPTSIGTPAPAPATVPAPPGRSGWSRVGWVLRDLALIAGLVLVVAGAWLVLVTVRDPEAGMATDQLARHLDREVADSLRADRVAAFGTWFVNVSTTLVLGGVLFRSFVATAQSRALGWSPARILRAAALVGIVASLTVVPFRAAAVAGTGDGRVVTTDPATLVFVVTSRFGTAALLRVAGLLLAAFAVAGPGAGEMDAARSAAPRRRRLRRGPTPGPALDHVLGGLGALLLLASYGWVGHPQATAGEPAGPGPLLVLSQLVHVLAVSAWFGGIALLYLQIRAGRRAGDVRTSAEVVGRFSTLAGVALVLTAATGVALARSQIASVDALTTTSYGRALLLKLACVALVVAVGGYNKLFAVPRIVEHGGAAAWRTLHRTLLAEAAVMVGGVLLAVTAMVSGGL